MSGERTYRREDLAEARRRWAEGEFGSEWKPYRTLAELRGFIFPPDGTRWDSTEDEQPSQRAIVYRALTDTPTLLRATIAASWSWGQVVAKLMADVRARREDADLAERDAAWDREHQLTKRQAFETYGEISRRMGGR